MSTSKGRGASAHAFTRVVPAEQTRFLFVRARPSEAIEFDPDGTDAVPRLFDEFDRLAAATAGREVKGELPSGYESIFRYSLVDPDADAAAAARAFRPAFGHLALLAQVPGVDVAARVEAEKGAPLTPLERTAFQERLGSARAWLEAYAPDRARIEIRRDALPAEAADLAPGQRAYLGALGEAAGAEPPASGEAWQALIFSVAAAEGVEPRAAFAALYLAVLGRANGPRAGLAPRKPRPRVRDTAPRGGGRGDGGDTMSVGVQRLREEPDRIRQGAIDKGEDPGIVDRALEVDATRRRLQAESDSVKAQRNAASRRIGEAIRGGARPDGPEVAELRAESVRAGERIDAIDGELATAEAGLEDLLLRIPNPADPDVPVGGEEANVVVRTWGEPAGHEAAAPDAGDVGATAALGDRRGAGHHRQRARGEDRGFRVPGLQGRRARGSSAPSSPGSWTSTPPSTASSRSGRPPS